MKTGRLTLLLLILLMSISIAPPPVFGVNRDMTRKEKLEKKKAEKDERVMDGLSLASYVTTVASLAGLFFTPATIIGLPVAFVLGLVALVRRRGHFQNRRGKGLALTAVILGGAFTTLAAIELLLLIFLF